MIPLAADRRRVALAEARQAGIPEHISFCGRHGPYALFDTTTGACLSCVADHVHLGPGWMYKASYGDCYIDTCEIHGETTFNFKAKCQSCFDSRGIPLGKKSPRALARRAEAQRYLAACPMHGQHEHHVNTGKCLACFTTSGVRREQGPRNEARAAARLVGDRTYLSRCDVHGEHPHDTIRGKCLGCFTTLGQPRKRPAG